MIIKKINRVTLISLIKILLEPQVVLVQPKLESLLVSKAIMLQSSPVDTMNMVTNEVKKLRKETKYSVSKYWLMYNYM